MEHTLAKITLEYLLLKLDEESINRIILNQFDIHQKMKILLALPDERIKTILLEHGFTDKFLNTI